MRPFTALTMNLVVAGLVAIDAVLVVAAVHHASGSPVTAPVSLEVSQSPSPTPSQPAAAATATHSRTLLSFSSASTGWRADAGCRQRSHLAMTVDGGRSWQRVVTPAPYALRIDMTSPTAGWIVGAAAGCQPGFFSTSDAGKTWTSASGLGQAWVVLGHRLRRPAGSLAAPCGRGAPVDAVTPASVSIALVTCGSRLLDTSDGGATWQPVGAFPHGGRVVTAALVPGSAGRGVALLSGVTGCAGLAVARTEDAGGRWQGGPCLSALRPPATVSLAADGSGCALGRGNSATTTDDAGASWT